MATYGWRTDNSLSDWLYNDSPGFDFYQAVKLLQLMKPDAEEIGEGPDPAREPVCFKSEALDRFPLTDIAGLESPESPEEPPTMKVAALSLGGNFGPLPRPYSELLEERIANGDITMREFLNIFNHRLISLLYRVRKKNRLALVTEEPHKTSVAMYLFSLLGLSTPDLSDRMAFPDRALLPFTGLLSQRPRSVAALENVVSTWLAAPVKTRSMIGRWLHMEEDQITTLGPSGRNNRLGTTAILGTRIWDQQGKIELLIGPLPLRQFLSLLPDGRDYKALCDLISFCIGKEIIYDIRLGIRRSDIPPSYLRKAGPGDPPDIPGMKLGGTAWLKSRRAKKGTVIDWQVKFGETLWAKVSPPQETTVFRKGLRRTRNRNQ